MEIYTGMWHYVGADNKILWKKSYYDSTLIPTGGYVYQETMPQTVEGYGMIGVNGRCEYYLKYAMDMKKKLIKGRVKSWSFK